jgi:hypothetical protein
MRYEDWVETKIIEATEADDIVDKEENSSLYQNAYVKKKPFIEKKKDENGVIIEQTQETDGLDNITNMDDLDKLEREEAEDEEMMRCKNNPEFYEDTVEY